MEHHESVRNMAVVKGGLSIMCPSVSLEGISIDRSLPACSGFVILVFFVNVVT